MRINKGINRNSSRINRETGDWERARNVMIKAGGVDAINEPGFNNEFSITKEITIDGTPTTKSLYIIGICPTPTEIVLFSVGYGYSQIDVVRDGVRTTIISTLYLYFKETCQIDATYKYNYLDELIVAWCDGTATESTAPKVLNLDNLPFDIDGDKELVTAAHIKFSLLTPEVSVPTISVISIDTSGGYMKTGSYYFSIAYVLNNMDITNYLPPSDPVPIANLEHEVTGYTVAPAPIIEKSNIIHQPINVANSILNEYSNSVINLKISNLDTDYSKIRLSVIIKTSDSLVAHVVGDYSIFTDNIDISFDGHTISNLNVENIIIPNIAFDKVASLISLEDRLLTSGVITNSEIDYQKYANAIQTTWGVNNVPSSANRGYYGQSLVAATIKSALPGEVYALFIHLVLKDGSITNGYHIPGREVEAISGTAPPIMENVILSTLDTSDPLYPNVNERDISDDLKHFHTRETASVPDKFGFWENEHEIYPYLDTSEIWTVNSSKSGIYTGATLAGNKVRHHKMPEESTIYDVADYYSKYIYINFYNIRIPSDIGDKVKGFIFSYASREGMSNRTIIGHSPAIGDDFYDYTPAPPAAPNPDDIIRIYEAGLLSVKPAINPLFIKSIYEDFRKAGKPNLEPATFTSFTGDIRAISKSYYTIENNSVVEPINSYREECIRIFGNGGPSGEALRDLNVGTKYHFINVYNFIRNIFSPYYNQQLVIFGSIQYTNDVDYLYDAIEQKGLDTTLERIYIALFNDDVPGVGIPKTVHTSVEYTCYHTINVAFITWRAALDTALIGEGYFPGYGYVDSDNNDHLYYIDNNSVLNSVNNIKTLLPYDPNSNFTNNLLKTTYRSDVFQSESLAINWRYFRTDAYSNEVYNKGDIVKVATDGVNMFIQYKHGLYITKLRDELQISSDVVAALGEVDIFQAKPKELISKDGKHINCDSLACFHTTDIGFVIVDRYKGIIFAAIGNEITNISDVGLRDYFKGKLRLEQFFASLLFLSGSSAVFDSDNDRLIVSHLHHNFSREYHCPAILLGYYNKIYVNIISGITYSIEATLYNAPDVVIGYTNIVHNGFLIFDVSATKTFTATQDAKWLYIFSYSECSLIISSTDIEDKSFTYSFHIGQGKWIADHNYIAEFMLNTASNLYSIKNELGAVNTALFKHNIPAKYGSYHTNDIYPSYIDITVNDSVALTKLFNSIFWITSVKDSDTYKWNNTITHILIYNDVQCTGLIPLTSMTEDDGNVKYMDGSWQFDDFDDIVIDPTTSFMDVDGDLINTNLSGIDLIPASDLLIIGNRYEVYNGTSPADYITDAGVKYYNGDVFVATTNSMFGASGTAVLKTAKLWNERGNIRGKYVVIRLYFDNVSQFYLEFNELIANLKQQF